MHMYSNHTKEVQNHCKQRSKQCAGVELTSMATGCIILMCHLQCDMVKRNTSLDGLWFFFFLFLCMRVCVANMPPATEHIAYSCYLMSCLVHVPLSSVRSRSLFCARLCLRDGSAYTSFLRIHTQGSSRQSKPWGEQQQTHSVFNCRETQTKTHNLLPSPPASVSREK